MTSDTKRSVWSNLKFPFRRFTTNSFTGASWRTVGFTISMAALNRNGRLAESGEITIHGWEPSHAGGVSEKGKSSTFTGEAGRFHKKRNSAQPSSASTSAHFHSGGCQKFFSLLRSTTSPE